MPRIIRGGGFQGESMKTRRLWKVSGTEKKDYLQGGFLNEEGFYQTDLQINDVPPYLDVFHSLGLPISLGLQPFQRVNA
jgi:hypothetical protein